MASASCKQVYHGGKPTLYAQLGKPYPEHARNITYGARDLPFDDTPAGHLRWRGLSRVSKLRRAIE
eukprot:6667890-Lingulodinium_polyedra.AAC.1